MTSDTYDPSIYPPFAVVVDLVVLTIRDHQLCVLLVERGVEPHKGRKALPGGFVGIDEDLETAAYRELAEETGIKGKHLHLEQLATYGEPNRDPRMRVVSVAHLAFVAELAEPEAGSDAAGVSLEPATLALRWRGNKKLAFDHARILADGVERARSKLEYSTLATSFLPKEFTVGEMRAVYEAVWDTEIDPRNFHRKVMASAGFVEPTGRTTTRGGGRPAQLLRAGPARHLDPPLTRP